MVPPFTTYGARADRTIRENTYAGSATTARTPVAAGLAKLQLAKWVSAITGRVLASMETRCASARSITTLPAQSVRDGPHVGRDCL